MEDNKVEIIPPITTIDDLNNRIDKLGDWKENPTDHLKIIYSLFTINADQGNFSSSIESRKNAEKILEAATTLCKDSQKFPSEEELAKANLINDPIYAPLLSATDIQYMTNPYALTPNNPERCSNMARASLTELNPDIKYKFPEYTNEDMQLLIDSSENYLANQDPKGPPTPEDAPTLEDTPTE